MPKYIISSDSPISARPISGPVDPGYGIPGRGPVDPGWGLPEGGGDLHPEHPWIPPGVGIWPSPGRPAHPWVPPLPDTWPPLPPGIALPIPPTPEHPIAPLPDEEVDPPTVWPPVRPEFPDLTGKSIVLALLYVSRHEPVWGWVVIDHEEAKEKFKELVEKIKNRPHPDQGLPGEAQPK